MPEMDSFIAGMSAVRMTRMMAELSGIPARLAFERAHEALYFVGLGEARYRPLESYSLGMKQMAKLAQAIVHGPKLLFLDEPTNGLDPPHRLRMVRLIREIRDSGDVNIVLSSHLLRDVEECCDEVLILKDGEIAVSCNLEEERLANRKFILVETMGPNNDFAEEIEALNWEHARLGKRKIKMVLPQGTEIRDLYEIAARHKIQDPPTRLQERFAAGYLPESDGGPTVAVYERKYKAYDGEVTPQNWRYLVLPRYAARDVFEVQAVHRLSRLLFHHAPLRYDCDLPATQRDLRQVVVRDHRRHVRAGGGHEFLFQLPHGAPRPCWPFFSPLIVGPALVSADLRNNGHAAVPLPAVQPQGLHPGQDERAHPAAIGDHLDPRFAAVPPAGLPERLRLAHRQLQTAGIAIVVGRLVDPDPDPLAWSVWPSRPT